ncbi:hypothetical protein [Bradyrhizobium sp. SRS-191]|uniref:hypothetical protein n=1 Tax=Bradyrhizobium sp. SRS-191 TaxID=2962606 RepID=UPI00211E51FD|nr:hypothetical protein [Bradyrhizobium sp. SRS-191]
MGLVRKWLSRLIGKPLKIDDAFFGRLVSMGSYWEARRLFSPTGVEIELFIDAPGERQPPNAQQREFFAWVKHHYVEIMGNVPQVARPRYERWFRRSIDVPFEAEFMLTSFSIPAPMEGPAEWEMSFDSRTDPNHILVVELRGAEALVARMDG